MVDPPSLVFGRWVRPVGSPPTSLDELIEVDYEVWHVHVEGPDVTRPCHSVEDALATTPELHRVDGTDTTIHWPDVDRVNAAIAPTSGRTSSG